MKKIFTDCDIYEDQWYRDLPPDYKLLWEYICRKCQYGVWKVDFKLFEFCTGARVEPTQALDYLNKDKTRIEKLPDSRWFIVEFCKFQFGGLNERCAQHRHGIRFYEKFYPDLLSRVCSTLGASLGPGVAPTPQDKDKDKDKDNSFGKHENLFLSGQSGKRQGGFQKVAPYMSPSMRGMKVDKKCTSCGGAGWAPGGGQCRCWHYPVKK